MYTKIKSVFIRKKIKECPWKNRKYIDDLITIERFVLGETFGWVTGYIMHGLKGSYPHEFKTIHKELKPKQFKEEQEREKAEAKKEREEEETYLKQEKDELRKHKQESLKTGGKA